MAGPYPTKQRSTKTSREPSKASLREIPEVTLSHYKVVGRGTRVQLAQESLESVALDRKTVELLGGADGVREILKTVAKQVLKAR